MQNATDNQRPLVLTWPDREGVGTNRVTLTLRWLHLGGGVLGGLLLAALVLGAVAQRLHRQSALLYANQTVLAQRCEQLEQALGEARREMDEARESLAAVRSEEAKIRAWLGLEAVQDEPALAEVSGEGGKGSLGDEGLETVAPQARGDEAEAAEAWAPAEAWGLAAESRALAADLADLAVYVERQREGWDAIPAISPVDGEHWISSAFGWRSSPFTGKREFHNGLDMAGAKGTPVVATASGQVDQVFNSSSLGRGLSIDHGNGMRTIYGHLEKVLVSQGQRVSRGAEVGLLGSSGMRSTGPHVHYALQVDGQYVNPRNYLLDRTRVGAAVARR